MPLVPGKYTKISAYFRQYICCTFSVKYAKFMPNIDINLKVNNDAPIANRT